MARLVLALVVIATGFVGALATAQPPTARADWDAETANFLTIINNYRQQNGLKTLALDGRLQRAADWMANDQLNTARCLDNRPMTCDHTDSQRRDIGPRIRGQFGYPGSTIGENILAGPRIDAPGAFDGWRNSPTHNQNLLDRDWSATGIGRLCRADGACLWVQTFGSDVTEAFNPPAVGTTVNAPPPVPTVDPVPAAVRAWVGTWNTDRGVMRLAAPQAALPGSNPLSGTYSTDGSSVDGAVDGGRYAGTWFGPARADGTINNGDFEFTLSADGNSFTGRFRVGASEQWDPWNGTRAP